MRVQNDSVGTQLWARLFPEAVDASCDTRIRLICNAAGALLPTLAQELRDVFGGCTVLPSYGMTECMPIASPLPSYQLERPGCSDRLRSSPLYP